MLQMYGEIFNITNISGVIFRVLSFINVVYVHGRIFAQNGENVRDSPCLRRIYVHIIKDTRTRTGTR